MKESYSVSVAFMIPFFKYVASCDVSIPTLCRISGVDFSILSEMESHIGVSEINRLVENAIQMTGEQDLGLSIAKTLHIEMAGIIGYLMMNCKTVGDAIEQYCKYQSIAGNIVQMKISTEEEHSKISWVYDSTTVPLPRIHLETVAAMVVVLTQELTGQDLPVTEVRFSYPQPSYESAYTKIFKTKITFNAPETAILFSSENLSFPIRQPNSNLFELMEGKAAEQLRAMTSKQTTASQVRNIMRKKEPTVVGITYIAKELGINVRSLQLKLKEEGFSYRSIKDSLLQEHAVEYLKKGTDSITEISRRLGFSEPGAFHRSFKRWTGQTPGEFRQGYSPK